MKVIHANELDNQKVLVEFFAEDNYGGESQKICAGDYNRDQILIQDIQSMKLTEGAVITFFSDPGFAGHEVQIHQSLAAGGIQFACIKVKDGASHELNDEDLDEVVGGARSGSRSTGSRYGGNSSRCGADYSGVSDCGSYTCGAATCGAAYCAGNVCATDGAGAGGCGGNVCAAATCAADGCGANVCPAAVCGVNACPANTCAADVCGVNLLPVIPFI